MASLVHYTALRKGTAHKRFGAGTVQRALPRIFCSCLQDFWVVMVSLQFLISFKTRNEFIAFVLISILKIYSSFWHSVFVALLSFIILEALKHGRQFPFILFLKYQGCFFFFFWGDPLCSTMLQFIKAYVFHTLSYPLLLWCAHPGAEWLYGTVLSLISLCHSTLVTLLQHILFFFLLLFFPLFICFLACF